MENQSEHGRIITEYLTYNGLTFPVNVDYETYTEIVTDSNIRESYAKQLYQQIYGNVSQENNSCTRPGSREWFWGWRKALLSEELDTNESFYLH